MECSDPDHGHVLRSGWVHVKGIDVGLSYFRFTRLWLCLTEDRLLFFKDPTVALSKPNAFIFYNDIKYCSPAMQKDNCLKITFTSKTAHICFKTAQDLKLWTNEIEACLKPVLVIGDIAPTESLPFDKVPSDRFSPSQPTPSSYEEDSLWRRASALSGTTLRTTTVYTQRFSSWSASTACVLDEESWPELSDFKMDDDIPEVIEETEEDRPERPSSPVDPELVFDLDRVHLAVSDYPIGREKKFDIPDLTGQISKVDDHPLAVGGFSDIWRGNWDADDRCEMVAIKIIRSFCFDPKTDAKLQKRLKQELDIWKRLRHIHIVPLYGIVHDMGRYASMISPWMNKGNASKFFEDQEVERTLARRLKLLYEVASGLEYLHCFIPPVIHGDLKASNILVSDTGLAMLTDFGISIVIEETAGTEHTASTFAGSVRWMAFELFNGYGESRGTDESQGSVQLSTYSDIWSFGSTALEVVSGKLPYHYRKNDVQVLHEVMCGLKPLREELRAAYPTISPDMWTFLHSCWRDDPKSRPSATSVKETIGQFFREKQRMGVILQDIPLER